MEDLGPLAGRVGSWEGGEGRYVSFSHGAAGPAETPFRERMSFEPLEPLNNGA